MTIAPARVGVTAMEGWTPSYVGGLIASAVPASVEVVAIETTMLDALLLMELICVPGAQPAQFTGIPATRPVVVDRLSIIVDVWVLPMMVKAPAVFQRPPS